MQVNMLDAKTNLSKLVKKLESKEETEIILARGGNPVAKIVPFTAKKKFYPGIGRDLYPDLSFPDDALSFENLTAGDEEIAKMFYDDVELDIEL